MRIPTISTRITNPITFHGLLVIILLELFLGGGGRLIDFGTLSLRMYLFIIGLIAGIFLLMKGGRMPANFMAVMLMFLAVLIFSSAIGIYSGASLSRVMGDIKPQISFLAIIFFSLAITRKEDVELVSRLVRFSAIILAIAYMFTLLLLHTGILPFQKLYAKVSGSEEFFFRGEIAFFYKGFVFLCIGVPFFFSRERRSLAPILLLIAAIILTFTRGFFLSTILTYLFYHTFIRKSALKLVLYAMMIVVAMLMFWNVFYQSQFNRKGSDRTRIEQVSEVIEAVQPVSFFIGHGFGIGVQSRPEHMEITYAEIFHKQGLMGLLVWFSLLALVWSYYKHACAAGYEKKATPFILASVFIYIQSISNPFLSNPIGISVLVLSLVCLRVLSYEQNRGQSPGTI